MLIKIHRKWKYIQIKMKIEEKNVNNLEKDEKLSDSFIFKRDFSY